MATFNWKSLVETVAPWIGGALGGPLGAAALSEVADAVLGDPKAPEAKVAAALAQATPELLAKIKARDQAFQVKMEELGFQREQLKVQDTDSARATYVATRSRMVPGLAFLAVGGFIAMGLYVLLHGVIGLDAATTSLLMYLLAKLDSKVEQVYHFFFGTSSGSEKKTDILAQQAQS